jgi:hypothetical protein
VSELELGGGGPRATVTDLFSPNVLAALAALDGHRIGAHDYTHAEGLARTVPDESGRPRRTRRKGEAEGEKRAANRPDADEHQLSPSLPLGCQTTSPRVAKEFLVACVGAVNKSRNTYLIAATVVWAAIWVATGVIADNEFDDMIPILGGGTVFFIVLVPATSFGSPTRAAPIDVLAFFWRVARAEDSVEKAKTRRPAAGFRGGAYRDRTGDLRLGGPARAGRSVSRSASRRSLLRFASTRPLPRT